ncbi:small nuclear RNA activating complex, polypeptide 3 [Mortierella sp. NVP85]|nr:small nuclear RNA activating complex, polypeptide 3 [Mortierella sp. NVP85]
MSQPPTTASPPLSPSHPPTFASSSSSQPRDRRKKKVFTPSIVTAEPQGDLFPLLPFGLNFKTLVEQQEDHDPYYEYFDDRDQEYEVAERCDTWKHQVEANKLFEEPTVFGLLKEWHDQRIEPFQEVQDPTLRPTWASVYGQAEDDVEHGNIADMYPREHPQPGGSIDDGLRRLLSSSARGRRQVPYRSRPRRPQRGWLGKRPHTEALDEEPDKDEDTEIQRTNKGGMAKSPFSNAQDTNMDLGSEESWEAAIRASTADKTTSTTSTTLDLSPMDAREGVQHVEEPMTRTDNLQNLALDPTRSSTAATRSNNGSTSLCRANGIHAIERDDTQHDDTEHESNTQGETDLQDGEGERIPITSLEHRFHEYSLKIEDSRLKCLADECRVELPMSYRPPLNYLEPRPSRYSVPYKPVLDTETVVSVALYRAHQPSQRMQEFLFLGSQPLTAMRDAFHCRSDFPPYAGDDDSPYNTKTRKSSNSYMLIEGVFYVDSPLLRAKIDKKNELQEMERKRLEDLGRLCKERYQEALLKRKEDRRRTRKERSNRLRLARLGKQRYRQENEHREEVGHRDNEAEESGEGDDEDDDDDGESDLEYDDSDLRAQMRNSTYRDLPVEEIKVEDEEGLAGVSHDYSQTILDWINADPKRKEIPGYQNLQKKHMHGTLIQDLRIRINYPYLLVHQGDCEHILMFRDLR